MPSKVNVGIFGLGRVGRRRLAILEQLPDVGSIAFHDPVVDTHEERQAVSSAEAILSDPDIHAIVVSTPNAGASGYVLRALAAGKHVFCEKPPGVNLAEAHAMAAAARERPGRILKFGFNHRYLAHFRALKAELAAGRHGRVLWCKATYGKGHDRRFAENWRADRRSAGGGILLDQGIHALDLLLELLGDLRVEHATVESLLWPDAAIEDNVFAQLRSHGGTPVSFHSSMTHWTHTLRIEVATERTLFVMSGLKSSTRSYGDETLSISTGWRDNFAETRTLGFPEEDAYTMRAELSEFLDAVQQRAAVTEGTPEDAVRVMQLVDRIYAAGGAR